MSRIRLQSLALVATALPAATGLLELAALGSHVWRGAGGTGGTEVTVGLTSSTGSADEQAVGASGELLGELIEGQDLAATGEDAVAGGLGESQSADLEALGGIEHADIIGDGANHDCDLALLAGCELYKLGKGDWGTVHLAHEETLQDHLVELAFDAAGHEAVELQPGGKQP